MYYSIIPMILLIILVFIMQRNQQIIAMMTIKRRAGEDMKELVKKFVGKECIIYTYGGMSQFTGVITEVTDGAILIENQGELQAVNLNFIARIREYPKKKNGKKKSVVID